MVAVVQCENAGDIHTLGTGLAVAAGGTAHLHLLVDGPDHRPIKCRFLFSLFPYGHITGGADIFHNHLIGIHAGEDHRDLFLIPQPPQTPFGRSAVFRSAFKSFQGFGRQVIHQFTAPQRLHDDHRQTLGMGMVQSPAARLRMFIQIIILDLAEIPGIGIH